MNRIRRAVLTSSLVMIALCVSLAINVYSAQISGAPSVFDTLNSVFNRGKSIVGANSFANAFRVEDGSTTGWAFYTHATDGARAVPYCNGVENDCNRYQQVGAGRKAGFKDSGGNIDFEYTESSGEITALTVNEETSGVNITRTMEVVIPLAGCVGASAFSNMNDDATGATAPTAACNDTGSIQDPSLDFAGNAVNTAQLPKFRLPTGWTGNLDLTLAYVTVAASPSGNVEWDISTVCRAAGESWDGSFNSIQTITDAAGSQNFTNEATQSALTTTGCAAGEYMTVKISRDGTNDTNNDLAKATTVTLTMRATK